MCRRAQCGGNPIPQTSHTDTGGTRSVVPRSTGASITDRAHPPHAHGWRFSDGNNREEGGKNGECAKIISGGDGGCVVPEGCHRHVINTYQNPSIKRYNDREGAVVRAIVERHQGWEKRSKNGLMGKGDDV